MKSLCKRYFQMVHPCPGSAALSWCHSLWDCEKQVRPRAYPPAEFQLGEIQLPPSQWYKVEWRSLNNGKVQFQRSVLSSTEAAVHTNPAQTRGQEASLGLLSSAGCISMILTWLSIQQDLLFDENVEKSSVWVCGVLEWWGRLEQVLHWNPGRSWWYKLD